jgi:hypothetical protein
MSGDRRKNTPQEIAEVALAFAAGKSIETRAIDGPLAHWHDAGNPAFNFYYYQYRVKAEPRSQFVVFKDGHIWYTRRTKDEADSICLHAQKHYPGGSVWEVAEFVEVVK